MSPLQAVQRMRMKIFHEDGSVTRPIVAFSHVFAVPALLVCVTTPFMTDVPNRWTFLSGGLGYSAFLAFFTMGLVLLPQKLRFRVLIAMFVGQGFFTLIFVGFIAILHSRLPFAIIQQSLPALLWSTGASATALFAFACYGWYCHFTRRRLTSLSASHSLLL